MLSTTEENYLKAIFNLHSKGEERKLGTNELADELNVVPATVTNMLKKLREKEMVDYQKYGSISLTSLGLENAVSIVRKHRLWETFLYERLEFTWDEVHEVAEQLEHIKSKKLVDQLDKMLDYPEVDPHGDPIPKSDGKLDRMTKRTLVEVPVGGSYQIVSVKDASAAFLKYAASLGIGIDLEIKVHDRKEFDDTIDIEVAGRRSSVSRKFAENVFVT